MSRSIRSQIKSALPAATFTRRPLRALLVPVWLTVAAALGATIVLAGLPLWANLGLAVLLGNAFAVLGLTAHEVMHGTTVRNRRLQDILGWVGFLPFLVSPSLWREWHNKRHHGHANQGEHDPDSFGHVSAYGPRGDKRVIRKLLPGSRSPLSWGFLAYWFTTHNLAILVSMSRKWEGFDRRPALLQTGLAALVWVGIIALTGWSALLVVLVPMLVGNAVMMSYIGTNHLVRQETLKNDPLDNAMSLRTYRWVDVMHGWFSLHVEHHLFPGMNPSQAPKVKRWLEANAAEKYVRPSHARALWYLYRTPRPHDGPTVLADPDRPRRRIDLHKLSRVLRDGSLSTLLPDAEPTQEAALEHGVSP
jgi:fatty acid desaturase